MTIIFCRSKLRQGGEGRVGEGGREGGREGEGERREGGGREVGRETEREMMEVGREAREGGTE